MDPMKPVDPRENIILVDDENREHAIDIRDLGVESVVTDGDKAGAHMDADGIGVISAVDDNGKPIAGRYPWEEHSNRIADMALNGASQEELEKAIEESKEFIDGNRVYHPDAYERQAQMMAVDETTEWIRQHPGYSMDELKEAKAGFLEKARETIRKATQELEARFREGTK